MTKEFMKITHKWRHTTVIGEDYLRCQGYAGEGVHAYVQGKTCTTARKATCSGWTMIE